MINPGMQTEAGRAAGPYRGSNAEQGLWFCSLFPGGSGRKKAQSFFFSPVSAACTPPAEGSLLTLSRLRGLLGQVLATALSRFRNILLNSQMK